MAVAKLKFTPKTLEQAEAVLGNAGKSQVVLAGNTLLTRVATGVEVTYHGNPIVRYTEEGTFVSWAGWTTYTTTGRIHQLINGIANIKGGEAYLDGEEVSAFGWHKVYN